MLCYLANAKSKVDISSGFETFFENIAHYLQLIY
jgi:hypothetical protein